jgi:methylated-DNA-[protein]-cysteine S-methyltransferase
LRNNPFAPFVPCHRVIASNRSVGGFCGEWEKNRQGPVKGKNVVGHCDWKVKMLKLEGVEFDEKGYLIDPEAVL